MEQLDGIAETMGLVSLTSFADDRPVPEDFDGPPWELDEVLGPWDEWFDCAAGVSAAAELSAALASHPALQQRLASAGAVVNELNDLAQQLRAGDEQGARVRLQVSY